MPEIERSKDIRIEENSRELVRLMDRHMPEPGSLEVRPGLRLARANTPTDRVTGVYKPSLCVVAQGQKRFFLGDTEYICDAGQYAIATVEMPITGKVTAASFGAPYLSMRMELDPIVVGSVMTDGGMPSPSGTAGAKALVTSTLTPQLLDAVVRMLRLLDDLQGARILAPILHREIVYYLLIGDQGERLRRLPMMLAHSDPISKAVAKLKGEYQMQISMEGLARELGMSPSGFHHHFRSVMGMSPLQFQKLIRLQEARHLMLSEYLDASTAGIRVGYDDPSHFSRDYKRQFGDAPLRDAARLRKMTASD